MGILDLLGIGEAAAKPIEAIGTALSKVVTTDAQRLAAEQTMELLKQNPTLWTAEINKLYAQSPSFFNSGWRPFIGWVCGICVALYYIPQFILAAYLWFNMCINAYKLLPYPIDPKSLMELCYLMLGFGAYRSLEKIVLPNKK